MKLVGITKIRNEQSIIQDTLDFYSFCDALYVYDDMSTDDTVKICKAHPKVKSLIVGKEWDTNRLRAEYQNRQRVLEEAKKDNPLWIIYFDADERIDWDFQGYESYDGVIMKLFDYYIIEEDKNLSYCQREWLGPEYREILMMFRNTPEVCYAALDQREAFLKTGAKCLHAGYVKHYGKAISIEEWDATCDYYYLNFPQYSQKWFDRKGKAIHTLSDFDRQLIKWEEKEEKGILL